MAWRFKASKYRNSAPIAPKSEHIIRDLSIGSYRSHGNFIAASAAYMAFNWDSQGSNLAVLPLDTKGRQNKASVPLIYAHSDFVTDFAFSPFDDGLLATASQDLTVKLWRIPESGMPATGLNQPELVLPSHTRRVETVNFHPTADCVLASTSFDTLVIWDLIQAKELYNTNEHDDEIQSVAWQWSGSLLATQNKDRQLRIFDPRSSKCVAQCDSHQGMKDSRVVWINDDHGRLFTTGFTAERSREIAIRDLRNLSTPQKDMSLDMSAGILVPLYDPDSHMCFLAGKGDRNLQFIEISDKEPFIVEGLKYSGDQSKGACLVPKRAMNVMEAEINRVLLLGDSSIVPLSWQVPRKSYREYHADIYPETYGLEPACGPETWWKGSNPRVPKMNLDPTKRPKEVLTVFQGPVADRDPRKTAQQNGHSNNHAQNGQNGSTTNGHVIKPNPRPRCVVKANSVTSSSPQQPQMPPPKAVPPKPEIVPRASTFANNQNNKLQQNNVANNTKDDTNGQNAKNLDCVDEGLAMLRRQPSIKDRRKLFEAQIEKQENKPQQKSQDSKENKLDVVKENQEPPKNNALAKNIFKQEENALKTPEPVARRQNASNKRPVSQFVRVAKFKHLKGDVILKGKFENLKNLSRTMPAESNFFKANFDRIAVPLTGPGGKIAVFETKRPGRIPDGVTPNLINGSNVLDFSFDPFDNARLAACCDDGIVRIWMIPEEGLACPVNEPHLTFAAHPDKVQLVKWHPLAKDVLLTVAFDRRAKIWDVTDTSEPKIELEGHMDQIFSAEWSPSGQYLATVCKDGKIRIFNPRTGSSPIVEGGEIVAKKGARVAWVLNEQYLIVTGFSKQSERIVELYSASDLNLEHTTNLDVSPAILIPHYDRDSGTLFLTSKGESVVHTYEVSEEAPYLYPLSPYRPTGTHQGLAFLPKNILDVKEVEFARAYRLTTKTIEPISFKVPRVQQEFFHDDLFPLTAVTWEETMTAEEWFSGSKKQVQLISLCPEGMRAVSGSNNNGNCGKQNKQKETEAATRPHQPSSKQVEASLKESVSNMVETSNKLEQDDMEGVDEKEWE